MGTLQEYKPILKVSGTILFGAYYTCEITFFLLTLLTLNSIHLLSHLKIQDFIMIISCSLLLIMKYFINLKIRLFSFFSILIPVFLIFLDTKISSIIILLITIVYLKRGEKQKINHSISYFLILVTCLWSWIELNYGIDSSKKVALINICLILLSSFGIYYIVPDFFISHSIID